jgi:ABC-type Fe3+/spermidine/putrescine transport system ATPase subunit
LSIPQPESASVAQAAGTAGLGSNSAASSTASSTTLSTDSTLSSSKARTDGTQGIDLIVRPEKLRQVEPDAAQAVPGRVTLRVFLGNHWLFQVDTPLGPLHWTVPNQGLPSVEEGQAVHLSWDSADARSVPRGGAP